MIRVSDKAELDGELVGYGVAALGLLITYQAATSGSSTELRV